MKEGCAEYKSPDRKKSRPDANFSSSQHYDETVDLSQLSRGEPPIRVLDDNSDMSEYEQRDSDELW